VTQQATNVTLLDDERWLAGRFEEYRTHLPGGGLPHPGIARRRAWGGPGCLAALQPRRRGGVAI